MSADKIRSEKLGLFAALATSIGFANAEQQHNDAWLTANVETHTTVVNTPEKLEDHHRWLRERSRDIQLLRDTLQASLDALPKQHDVAAALSLLDTLSDNARSAVAELIGRPENTRLIGAIEANIRGIQSIRNLLRLLPVK